MDMYSSTLDTLETSCRESEGRPMHCAREGGREGWDGGNATKGREGGKEELGCLGIKINK